MPARKRKWVRRVQSTSNALDLERGAFQKQSPGAIARSILRSVRKSRRRKGTELSSGISMMTFYANRAGSKLSPPQKRKIQRAKDEYRKLVGSHGYRKD